MIVKTAIKVLIRAYQTCLKPCLRPCCRFSPSCSEYALQCIAKHRLPKAIYLITWRLMRCHPLSSNAYQYDPVPELD
ncbi:MAG: membrane protein insertion efficiency factor YidD [Legionellales bacterium]|nr:membrane protein insertion efficiency factor YidD [Legionellales bacterium]